MIEKNKIQFTSEEVTMLYGTRACWRLSWSQITRIGFETLHADPWFPDYFLLLQDDSTPPKTYAIDLECEGFHALTEFIEQTKHPTCKDCLVNRTTPETITIWPLSESGKPWPESEEDSLPDKQKETNQTCSSLLSMKIIVISLAILIVFFLIIAKEAFR